MQAAVARASRAFVRDTQPSTRGAFLFGPIMRPSSHVSVLGLLFYLGSTRGFSPTVVPKTNADQEPADDGLCMQLMTMLHVGTGNPGGVQLHPAAYLDSIEKTLDKGAPVNCHGLGGGTPLLLAATKGDTPVAKLLIQRGADVNAEGRNGLTPLHIAANKGNVEMVTALLDAGANATAATINFDTALGLAAQQQKTDVVEVLERFIERSKKKPKLSDEL